MKILQVTNFFKPSWEAGGPARSTYEISKKLVENGHDVTVYTTDGFKSRLDVIKNTLVDVDGIKTYYFRNLSSYLSRKMILPIPYYSPLVVRKDIKNFDIIHIHEYRTVLAIVIHYYAKKYKVPYILQPRGYIPTTTKSKQKKIFDVLFGYSIFKDASKIIASSKIESEQYRSVFHEIDANKIVHVSNSINLTPYVNLPKKGDFKKKYSINTNEKMVLFLGRLHEIKGINLLVEAFSDLKHKNKNIKLVVAGPDDGHIDDIKSIVKKFDIEDDVIFPGAIFGKDKISAYIDSDVFVLPSKYESFGNVVLEAMACGTPVIVTNNCGVSEWIDVDAGYIIEYNVNQLSNAMNEILSDELLKIKLSGNGKNLVRRKFDLNNNINEIEKIYDYTISAFK